MANDSIDKDPSFRIRFEVKRRNEDFDLKPVLDLYWRKAGADRVS